MGFLFTLSADFRGHAGVGIVHADSTIISLDEIEIAKLGITLSDEERVAAQIRTPGTAQNAVERNASCKTLTGDELITAKKEFDDWSGDLGNSKTRRHWPYKNYAESDLKRMARQGDAEASYQLGMNYRWQSLYVNAGSVWDPTIDQSTLVRKHDVDESTLRNAHTYLRQAVVHGYIFTAWEQADLTLEHLENRYQQIKEEEKSGKLWAGRADWFLDQIPIVDMGLRVLPYELLAPNFEAKFRALSMATDKQLSRVDRLLSMATQFSRKSRAAAGLPEFETMHVPIGALQFMRHCEAVNDVGH
jgi:hypothetical protein